MSSSSKLSGSTATAKQATQPMTQPQMAVPHEKIAMRAYTKWQQRGCPTGTEMQDWQEAEAELRAEMMRNNGSSTPASTTPPAKQGQRR